MIRRIFRLILLLSIFSLPLSAASFSSGVAYTETLVKKPEAAVCAVGKVGKFTAGYRLRFPDNDLSLRYDLSLPAGFMISPKFHLGFDLNEGVDVNVGSILGQRIECGPWFLVWELGAQMANLIYTDAFFCSPVLEYRLGSGFVIDPSFQISLEMASSTLFWYSYNHCSSIFTCQGDWSVTEQDMLSVIARCRKTDFFEEDYMINMVEFALLYSRRFL